MPNATRNFMLHLLLVFPNYNLAKCITYYTTFHQMKKWCSLKQDVAFLPCDKESKYPGGGGGGIPVRPGRQSQAQPVTNAGCREEVRTRARYRPKPFRKTRGKPS